MNWETVIGLEIHAELSTASKIFCNCKTTFGAAPNTLCCPVCTAMPGSLPVLNEQALKFAIKAGLALGCSVADRVCFDRKNYFYPDLPKAYQISQLYAPLLTDGSLTITTDGQDKNIGISNIHLEEDAGKLIHDNTTASSKIDYNRCGVPLIEIVTAPDFRKAAEVTEFIEELSAILQYINVCDCKMQEGSLRADINLSVRPKGSTALGTRTEMKNLNSLRAISRAIEYESNRQIQLLERGQAVRQETRRWDDDKCVSISMRAKESANDYRYFPDPDLPCVKIDNSIIDAIREELPELPREKRKRYERTFFLPPYDAKMLSSQKELASFFEQTVSICNNPKEAANRLLGDMLRILNDTGLTISQSSITPEKLALLIDKTEKKLITRQKSKEIFEKAFTEDLDIEQYIKDRNLEAITDINTVASAVRKTIDSYPDSVTEYLCGKTKVFGFLVGQTMRELKGRADPSTVNNVLKEQLNLLQNNS